MATHHHHLAPCYHVISSLSPSLISLARPPVRLTHAPPLALSRAQQVDHRHHHPLDLNLHDLDGSLGHLLLFLIFSLLSLWLHHLIAQWLKWVVKLVLKQSLPHFPPQCHIQVHHSPWSSGSSPGPPGPSRKWQALARVVFSPRTI
jgi:hypothetical protein